MPVCFSDEMPRTLRNTFEMKKSKIFEMLFLRCTPETSSVPCARDSEIDKFIKRINLGFYSFIEQVDFQIRDKKPVFLQRKEIKYVSLDPSISKTTSAFL